MSNLGNAAGARRLYHHVLNGGTITHQDMARIVRTIENLEAEVERRGEQIVVGFYEDETPQYHQGLNGTDAPMEIVTAKDCEALVAQIEKLKQAPSPDLYFISHTNDDGESMNLMVRETSPHRAFYAWCEYFDLNEWAKKTFTTGDPSHGENTVEIFEITQTDKLGALGWHNASNGGQVKLAGFVTE